MNYSHDNDHCSDGGGGGQKYKRTIKPFPAHSKTDIKKNLEASFLKLSHCRRSVTVLAFIRSHNFGSCIRIIKIIKVLKITELIETMAYMIVKIRKSHVWREKEAESAWFEDYAPN